MLAQRVQERFRGAHRIAQPVFRSVGPPPRDPLQNVGLRLGAKTLQFRDPPFLTSRFQLGNRVNSQFPGERLDFLRPQARNLQHFHQARRDGGLQFLVVFQFSGLHQFGDFLFQRLPDAFDFAQPLFGHDFGQGFVEAFNHARRIGVGPGLEGILALEFQQHSNLDQDSRDLFLVHAFSMATGAVDCKLRQLGAVS